MTLTPEQARERLQLTRLHSGRHNDYSRLSNELAALCEEIIAAWEAFEVVSTFDHEICKRFAERVRERLVAAQPKEPMKQIDTKAIELSPEVDAFIQERTAYVEKSKDVNVGTYGAPQQRSNPHED